MTTFDQVDEVLFRIHARVLTQGLYVDYVFGDGSGPPWAYTVGLLDLGHPEVIVFGLDPTDTQHVVQTLFDEIECGIVRPVGRSRRQRPLGCPPRSVRLIPVAEQHWECAGAHRMCVVSGYHRALGRADSELHALQLVWATSRGTFPWHARASKRERGLQPLLDED